MLVTPILFLHYSYTCRECIFVKEWLFLLDCGIYDYRNFGKGDEHGISRGCKNSGTYLYNQ